MTTRANGGLNSSEEREGQQMVPAHGRKQMHGPDRRNLQLRFQSIVPDSFFTKRKVEGQRGAPIHVKLTDTSTGHVVRSGPESCVKLKVVVVEGDFNNEDDDDWTQEDFEGHLVKEREGKSPLLIGKLHVHLKEGVGSLGKLSFTDNSSWTRSKKFRLGVKVASGLREGIRVLEAITNPFVVKDCRGEAYKKHVLPALDDEIWRLKQIRRNGPFHEKLNKNGIFIVEDFLWLLRTDPKGLRKILGSSMRGKMWDALVEHAKTCDLRGKHYVYYADNTKSFGVVFKSICELGGYIAGGKYYSAESLSNSQKVLVDTLKRKAYDNWKHIVEYDGRMLDMNQSAAPSEQDVVNPGPAVGGDFFNRTVAGGWHGFLGLKDVRMECGSSVLSENYESGSRTSFSSIGDMVSVPCGKYHVYYTDNTKNSGVVFKNMSELCGLIEGGEYYSTEILSVDSQKVFADTLKKEAYAEWKDIVEYDGLLPLEMNPSKRARSSQTDIVAPESCPSDIDQRVSPAFLTHVASQPGLVNPGLAVGAPVPCQPPSVPSGEASKNSMPDSEDLIFGSMLDDDLIDLPSLFLDLSEKADGNTELSIGSLDAFCREVDLSHLPESSLDPSEQANGAKEVSVEDYGGSFEQRMPVGGSNTQLGRSHIFNSMIQHTIYLGFLDAHARMGCLCPDTVLDMDASFPGFLDAHARMNAYSLTQCWTWMSLLFEIKEFKEVASLESKFGGLSVA